MSIANLPVEGNCQAKGGRGKRGIERERKDGTALDFASSSPITFWHTSVQILNTLANNFGERPHSNSGCCIIACRAGIKD